MEKIRFLNNQTKIYDGKLSVKGDTLTILFESEIPSMDELLGGFDLLNEHNGHIQGGYHDYSTLYRAYEDNSKLFELSKDGSVYVPYVPTVFFNVNFGGTLEGEKSQKVNSYDELIIPTPVPAENYVFDKWIPEIPESGEIKNDLHFSATFTYVPTAEEIAAQFEQNKTTKILESKSMLEAYLENHPLVSTCHNGVEGTYTITSEKQTLMSNNYFSYTIAKQMGQEIELTWNETGKECEVWTEAEFLQLIMEVQAFVKPLVSMQQKYEVMINACQTQEELDSIYIDYGQITVPEEPVEESVEETEEV